MEHVDKNKVEKLLYPEEVGGGEPAWQVITIVKMAQELSKAEFC